MSDFKKLGCGVNCPTKTGFTDCEGEPILSNASLATCADLEKLDPNKPVEPSEYCPSVRLACAGSYGYGFAPDDNRDPAATVEVKDCDNNLVCYIYQTSAAGHTIAIKDCDGVLVGYSANASQCAGGSLVTISGTQATGNVIATVTIDGTPTDIKESITSITDLQFDAGTSTLEITFLNETGTPETSEVEIPVKVAVEHISPVVINPANTYLNYANQIVVDANGNFYGFNAAGQPTKLNITETVTRFKSLKTTGNPIGTYENEQIADFILRETITNLKSLTYNKATSVLTAVYTDETGTDITKTTEIKAQATAFINGTNPATATIFSLTTPPTVNDNTLKNNDDYVYVGTDGSYWFWNGTAYVTAPVPAATTEWNFGGTNVDAKGDKINRISRTGWVAIGKTGTPGMAIDTETSGTNQFLPVARFLGPGNAVVGNSTQLVYGVSQSYGNAADWRFYYAGSGNAKNRIDFGWSGVFAPVISYLLNGNVGINMTDPLSKLDVEGAIGFRGRLANSSTSQTPIDGTVVFTAAGSVYTLEAPSATTNKRRLIAVKNASTGTIFINGHIDNVAGVQLAIASGGAGIFHTEGTSWWRIADNKSEASARSNRGTDVTLDNLKFRVAASGNASLQVSTVSGTVTVWGTSSSNFETNAAVSTLAVTTTPVYIRPALNLPNAGDIQRFLFVTSDNRSYEVRLCIAPGYTSNMIHIERLS
jgi:hypothetical protein